MNSLINRKIIMVASFILGVYGVTVGYNNIISFFGGVVFIICGFYLMKD